MTPILRYIKKLVKESYVITEDSENKGNPKHANAMGVAFEIRTAMHLGHLLHGKSGSKPEDHYPGHFSDESGSSPRESDAKQRKILGDHLHNQIDNHARRTAHHIFHHINAHSDESDEKLTQENSDYKVHWTSKPKDLERLTGIEGIKGTSDITVSHGKKFHGISLKYSAAGTKPSLRSPGIEDLTKTLKADPAHVEKITKQRNRDIDIHVGSMIGQGNNNVKHAKFKALSSMGGSVRSAINNAKDASRHAHRQLAGHFSDSFNKLDHKDHVKFIRRMTDAEEQPTIKPYRASFDAKRGKTHITNPTKDFDSIHSTVHHYSAEHSGASANIFAHHHNGNKTKVTSFSIKDKSSSPYKGLAGKIGDVSTRPKKVIRRKK